MTPRPRFGLLALASRFLPKTRADQYLSEWSAESDMINEHAGPAAAYVFRAQVLAGAPRLAFALRSTQKPFMFDWLIVSLTLLVPGIFYTAHAIIVEEALLSLALSGLIVGLAAFSHGVWTADAGLVGARAARAGLALIALSATAVPIATRVGNAVTPMASAPYVAWPATLLTTLGVAILAASAYFREQRVSVVHFGLLVLMGGFAVWLAIVVANASSAETWFERCYHLCIVPSAIAIIHVSMRIRKAGSFFVMPKGRVIPHQ